MMALRVRTHIRTGQGSAPQTPPSPPSNTVAPAVTGTTTLGQTLSCSTGTWTNSPSLFTYQWIWADTSAPISGATSATYVLQAGDVGHTIKCAVTASNAGGSATANSNTTAAVTSSGVSPAFSADFTSLSALPTGVSLSRATTGTYFDASGVMQTAAINAPRFDHAWNGSAWVAKGLLDEEQRTNLHKSSGDLTNADWSVGGLSRVASSTLSPNGVSFMTEFTSNSGNLANGAALYNSTAIAYTANTVVTISRFFKKSNYDYVFLSLDADVGTAWVTAVFNLSTGLMTQSSQGALGGTFISASLENVGGGIYRAKLTGSHGSTSGYGTIGFAQAATGNTFDDFGNVVLTGMAGTEKFLAWGAGFEVGSFATSYIPTTTAAATRSADITTLSGAADTAAKATSGTILIEFGELPFDRGSSNSVLIASTNYFPLFRTGASNNRIAAFAFHNGNTSVYAGTMSDPTSVNRAGIAHDGTSSSLSLNGDAVQTGTGTEDWAANGTIYLGVDSAGGESLDGHIRSIAIYTSRLSDADLQTKSVVGATF